MYWSLSNETSGVESEMYKDGKVVGDRTMYEVINTGNTSNITVHGRRPLFFKQVISGQYHRQIYAPVTN